MSSFNETIGIEGAQSGNGNASATAGRLAGVVDKKCYKKVIIKKDGTETDVLYVGFRSDVSSSNGFALEAGDQVELEIDNPNKIWVVGSDADVAYSWLAY